MSVYYVATFGFDNLPNNGEYDKPFNTINNALNKCKNNDIIKIYPGNINISSTININKQVTIQSITNNVSDVIITGTDTIFNIQENNITLNYLTLQSNTINPCINIDIQSDGLVKPNMISINIYNCNIKYIQNALILNGKFNISNNTFSRYNDTKNANVIQIYYSRNPSSISNNTFFDSNNVSNFIQLNNITTNSNTYYDFINSKNTITIDNNIINYFGQLLSTFINISYFNSYNILDLLYYTLNTKIKLIVTNNTYFTPAISSKFIEYNVNNNILSSLSVNQINNNIVLNTTYGIVNVNSSSVNFGTVNNNIFKIYNNTLGTIIPATGRFIKLKGNSDFKLNNITIYSKTGIDVSTGKSTINYNLTSNGNSDSLFNSNTFYATDTSLESSVVVDLENNIEIGYIKLTNNNSTTINNITLYILYTERDNLLCGKITYKTQLSNTNILYTKNK